MDPVPDGRCEGACCRSRNKAVVVVSGEVHDGPLLKTVTLKLCAECAGPLLRRGQLLTPTTHAEN